VLSRKGDFQLANENQGTTSLAFSSYWLIFSRLQPIIDALGHVPSLEGHSISAEVKKTHR